MKQILCALALTMGVAYADIPANLTNQTVDGAIIQGGTYFNTAGSETKFINSAGTGITLNAGHTIRGLEVYDSRITIGWWSAPATRDFSGKLSGNGGHIHIQAPDQVVRLNGNIDVRGFQFGRPTGDGNGGQVTIDAAYLFQNGNIYATGTNGGSVEMNVGGMTMGSTSLIDAHSNYLLNEHPGGSVAIHSTGQVDIQPGAKIDVSGATGGNFFQFPGQLPFNNISITGSVVNMDGILQASSAILRQPQLTPWPEGAHSAIRLVATQGDVTIGPDAVLQADSANTLNNTRTITITAARDINQVGKIWANGSKGGALFINAPTAPTYWFLPGGRGGSISLSAGHDINQNGRLSADGGNGTEKSLGGAGGTITLMAGESMINNGVIRAMGGNTNPTYVPTTLSGSVNRGGAGGSVNFNLVPNGNGIVSTLGGVGANPGLLGSITSPFVAESPNTLMGVWHNAP